VGPAGQRLLNIAIQGQPGHAMTSNPGRQREAWPASADFNPFIQTGYVEQFPYKRLDVAQNEPPVFVFQLLPNADDIANVGSVKILDAFKVKVQIAFRFHLDYCVKALSKIHVFFGKSRIHEIGESEHRAIAILFRRPIPTREVQCQSHDLLLFVQPAARSGRIIETRTKEKADVTEHLMGIPARRLTHQPAPRQRRVAFR
jgi:hypothetical protein